MILTAEKLGLLWVLVWLLVFPKEPEEENCTVLSSSYNVIAVNELYVNIKTETRDFAKITSIDKCTGRFNLSVYYQINRKDFKRVILPDEIPTKNRSFGERSHFYKTNNDLLGFQDSILLWYYKLCFS